MSHELLNHPEVTKTIRAELLRGGYPKEAIDDGVGEVVVKVFAYLKEQGIVVEEVDRMRAIVRQPSYQHGVDGLRGAITHKKAFGPNVEDADSHLAAPSSSMEDRLDAKKALETIRADQLPHEAVIVDGELAGKPQKVIARELNISHDQLRKEKGKMLTRHRARLIALGFVGIAVLLALIFRMRMVHDEEAQHPQPVPPPIPTAPPAPPEEVPVAVQGPTPEAKQQAAELRAAAHELAIAKKKKDQWKDCSAAYDKADALDPDGNTPAQEIEAKLCADRYLSTFSAKP